MDTSGTSLTNELLGTDHEVLSVHGADVGVARERRRRRRLWSIAVVATVLATWLTYRYATHNPVRPGLPQVDWVLLAPFVFFFLLIMILGLQFYVTGRSPHTMFQPEQIETRMSDVRGIDPVKQEAIRSLNLFLAHKTFAAEMGGTPRRGLLFEGPPGTGKTFLAKAMAREAGVPFLYASATSFQSSFYGATGRKIRSYFKELRRIADRDGGAIGFIDEIDAIASARSGVAMTAAPGTGRAATAAAAGHGCHAMRALPSAYSLPAVDYLPGIATGSAPATTVSGFVSQDVGAVVTELLVQMQSFDELTGTRKLLASVVGWFNLLLPLDRQLKKPSPTRPNVLLIAATNRGDNLDPAILRPGRFDRRLSFELPGKSGRRDIVDHYLQRKAHAAELDEPETRDVLAGMTQGYTPVMIEHLLDESLVNALRRGDVAMSWADVEQARLTEEIGIGQPVGYTERERRLIATHEAGHATVAWLVAPDRRLEVLSIIKRRSALGMLAHGDRDEVYTRGRREMLGLIQIAMGGQVAEELFFDDVSTGPSGDLLYATNVAAEMVGSCGMTDTLISYAAVQATAFNATNIVGRVLGDADGRGRVERLLQEQKATVRMLLAENMHLVAALRDALVERSELIGPDITGVLERAREEAAADAVPRVIDLRDHAGSGTPA